MSRRLETHSDAEGEGGGKAEFRVGWRVVDSVWLVND